jgi:hypothetical protein
MGTSAGPVWDSSMGVYIYYNIYNIYILYLYTHIAMF